MILWLSFAALTLWAAVLPFVFGFRLGLDLCADAGANAVLAAVGVAIMPGVAVAVLAASLVPFYFFFRWRSRT